MYTNRTSWLKPAGVVNRSVQLLSWPLDSATSRAYHEYFGFISALSITGTTFWPAGRDKARKIIIFPKILICHRSWLPTAGLIEREAEYDKKSRNNFSCKAAMKMYMCSGGCLCVPLSHTMMKLQQIVAVYAAVSPRPGAHSGLGAISWEKQGYFSSLI